MCGRWLTLRALRVHLLWTCTLAAAIFTLIPVVPTWLFGLPAAVELFARVRRIAALPSWSLNCKRPTAAE